MNELQQTVACGGPLMVSRMLTCPACHLRALLQDEQLHAHPVAVMRLKASPKQSS